MSRLKNVVIRAFIAYLPFAMALGSRAQTGIIEDKLAIPCATGFSKFHFPPEQDYPTPGHGIKLALNEALLFPNDNDLFQTRVTFLRNRFSLIQKKWRGGWTFRELKLTDGSVVFEGPEHFVLIQVEGAKIFRGAFRFADLGSPWRTIRYDLGLKVRPSAYFKQKISEVMQTPKS